MSQGQMYLASLFSRLKYHFFISIFINLQIKVVMKDEFYVTEVIYICVCVCLTTKYCLNPSSHFAITVGK